MGKYIALNSAITAVMNTEVVLAVGTAEPYQKTVEVMEALDNLTTIDIVRCKDCKHYNSETHGCKRNPSVEGWLKEDFCRYGEREEE